MTDSITLECPSCKTMISWNDTFPERPFCSKRCREADFIDWANEKHIVSGSPLYEDIYSSELPDEMEQ